MNAKGQNEFLLLPKRDRICLLKYLTWLNLELKDL